MAAVWTGIGERSVRGVMAATEVAPSGDADGMSLDGVAAISVWLEADLGETISADSGQVDIYVRDLNVWGIAPAVPLPIPPGSSGQRRVLLGSLTVTNPRGRLAAVCNGVVLSGGGATVELTATMVRHGYRIVEA